MSRPPQCLVTFAVRAEARPFARRVRGDDRVRILLTGIGPGPAAARLRHELGNVRPDILLTCGFAGGLAPELKAGTVLYSADDAFPVVDGIFAKAGARPGRFLLSPVVLTSAEAKKAARDRTGADAVDMESAVLREIAAGAGIPSATVRVISDEATEDLPLDFNRLLDNSGRVRTRLLLPALLAAPSRIPGLVRFQRRIRISARNLAATLVRLAGDWQ